MNYLDQFFGAISVNKATLSGAIDIIVVPQEDGTYLCSPFHVRFGKFRLVSSKEKVVSIKVNGKKTDLKMKLDEEGSAYFVIEGNGASDPQYCAFSPASSDVEDSALLMQKKQGYQRDSGEYSSKRLIFLILSTKFFAP
eukprot:GCRY01005501.1.p1 GENE.GCRY01005501.1~~GCRY01005501.1.p1  ORF type:complete len:139 (+),score=22.34 GCRY01005501.1:257-673(+)